MVEQLLNNARFRCSSFRPTVRGEAIRMKSISHLHIAPTVLKLLDIPIPETMKMSPL